MSIPAFCSDRVGLLASYGRKGLLDSTTPSLPFVMPRLAKVTAAVAGSMTSAIARPAGWSSFGEVVLFGFLGLGVPGFWGWKFADRGPKGVGMKLVWVTESTINFFGPAKEERSGNYLPSLKSPQREGLID